MFATSSLARACIVASDRISHGSRSTCFWKNGSSVSRKRHMPAAARWRPAVAAYGRRSHCRSAGLCPLPDPGTIFEDSILWNGGGTGPPAVVSGPSMKPSFRPPPPSISRFFWDQPMAQLYALAIGIEPDGSVEQRYLMDGCAEAFPTFATVIAREAGLNAQTLDVDFAGVVLARLCLEWRSRVPVRGNAQVSSRLQALTDHGEKGAGIWRSEEHTSELQSLMRISYDVFCLKKQKH